MAEFQVMSKEIKQKNCGNLNFMKVLNLRFSGVLKPTGVKLCFIHGKKGAKFEICQFSRISLMLNL